MCRLAINVCVPRALITLSAGEQPHQPTSRFKAGVTMRQVTFLAILTYVGLCGASDYQSYDGCNCDPGTEITDTNCNPKNSSTVLTCRPGRVIDVQSANYGRTDPGTCPSSALSNSSCDHSVTSTIVISNFCNKKQWCAIKDISDLLTDPCPTISKYLDIAYKCVKAPASSLKFKRVCESHGSQHPDIELTCDGGDVIHVRAAIYGRNDPDLCPHNSIMTTSCGNRASDTVKVQDECDGKSVCEFTPNNQMFGDHCPNTYKYLEVWWDCA